MKSLPVGERTSTVTSSATTTNPANFPAEAILTAAIPVEVIPVEEVRPIQSTEAMGGTSNYEVATEMWSQNVLYSSEPGPSNQQFHQNTEPQFNPNLHSQVTQDVETSVSNTLDDLMNLDPMLSNYSPPIELEQTTFENILNNLFDATDPNSIEKHLQLR